MFPHIISDRCPNVSAHLSQQLQTPSQIQTESQQQQQQQQQSIPNSAIEEEIGSRYMMNLSSRIPLFVLRLLALSATVSATVVMVTSHDSANVLGITFEAKFTNSPTFKYFVGINSIASVYTLVALFFPLKTPWTRLILLLDLMMTLLLDSSVSASLAIGQVGKSGDKHAGWLPVCGQVPKFCDHVAGALIAAFVAAVAYVIILLYSLHNVKNLCNSS